MCLPGGCIRIDQSLVRAAFKGDTNARLLGATLEYEASMQLVDHSAGAHACTVTAHVGGHTSKCSRQALFEGRFAVCKTSTCGICCRRKAECDDGADIHHPYRLQQFSRGAQGGCGHRTVPCWYAQGKPTSLLTLLEVTLISQHIRSSKICDRCPLQG